jgi:DNA processing protein
MTESSHPSRPPLAACDGCLARTWLIARVAGHLDVIRGRAADVLGLDDDELLGVVAGRERPAIERDRAAFDAELARVTARRVGVAVVCRCHPLYPARLRDLPAPPAALHVAGAAERLLAACAADPVAVVGTRGPSPYGIDMAASLSRQLACAGVAVISGMARGIDSVAHAAALGAEGGGTVAVLPAGAERPYPRSKRALYGSLVRAGAVVSELPPQTPVRRWMFTARNRIIAALATATVVVEAGERSGALVTARAARDLGRPLGAVPGRVTTPQAAGPHALLRDGAALIANAGDVLDLLFAAGLRADRGRVPVDVRESPSASQAVLLRELDGASDVITALARAGLGVDRGLSELAALELAGWVRRGPGGTYTVIP